MALYLNIFSFRVGNMRTPKNSKITVNGRPEFIPREIFREWLKPMHLNKHAEIDGILPSSYIARQERLGRPIQSKSGGGVKFYRLLDVVARARAEVVTVMPSEKERLERSVDALHKEMADLAIALAKSRQGAAKEKHALGLSLISSHLSGKVLLREEEIVAGAISYKPTCGIYFLIKYDRVRYVGQSVDVAARLRSHASRFNYDSFAFIPAEPESLNALESLYIHLLRPEWNGRLIDGSGRKTEVCVAPLALNQLFQHT